MSKIIHGNISGLPAQAVKSLEKLYQRSIPPTELLTQEFATHLTFLSHDLHRLVGVLVNRKGKVEHVIVGDVFRLYLPDIGRQRAGAGRFRGLRLLRTHLQGEPLTDEDQTDLSKLRLDALVSVNVAHGGYPGKVRWAHLIPENPEKLVWRTHEAAAPSGLEVKFDDFIAELEGEFQRKADTLVHTGGEPALLVYVDLPGQRSSASAVPEMLELSRTAGVEVRDTILQRRQQADPSFVVGKGKLEQIVLRALQLDATLLLFGCDLNPRQMRSITDATDLRVLDRTQLILDIFAQRASSHDGKLQVELAQLKYTLPRLASMNTGMSRLTGGIGGRGPGETKLEINRRRAHDKIQKLTQDLKRLQSQRAQRRQRRDQSGIPVVSIVGYTNAGKSTLLNTLTQAEVLAEDKLFATLETTSRRLRFPREREIVLTDTVGFIHDLPKDLVAAFKATLEELEEADLLLHVVDASTEGFEERIAAVNRILGELELNDKPTLLVFNKMDRLDALVADERAHDHGAIPISALDPRSTTELLDKIERHLFFGARKAKAQPQPTRKREPVPDAAEIELL